MYGKLISLVVLLSLPAGLVQGQVVLPSSVIGIESYDKPGYFIVCTTDTGPVQLVKGGNVTLQGKWKIISPGDSGTAGTISLQPLALPGDFMRQTNNVFNCNKATDVWLDKLNSTLIPVPGLADPTAVSFKGGMYPNLYLQHDDKSPMGLILAVAPANPGAATFRFSQDPERAKDPVPANKLADVPRDMVLSWTAGVYAATHDVYLGTSFDDVNSATRENPMGILAAQDQIGATFTLPQRLDFGATWYWRVDEVNAPPSSTIFKGEVWCFTAEPFASRVPTITATASSTAKGCSAQNTVDESGLTGDLHGTDPSTMWSSATKPTPPVWLKYDFDKVYKLYQMLVWNSNGDFESALNFGVQDATVEYSADGTTFTKLGDFVFAQGDSAEDYLYNTVVDFGGLAVKSVKITANSNYGGNQYGLAEVRFLYLPVSAREPKPATDSSGIDPTTVVLGWRPGREAASHNVLLGTDRNALTAAGTSPTNSFAPTSLMLSTKYYWRVDEVNAASTPTTWPSEVWNFTTSDFVVVDDFEKYDDLEGTAVFNVWSDGFGIPTNGATIGYNSSINGTYNETGTVHAGKQAMPFLYGDKGAATSEGTLAFTPAQDWTRAGIKTLTLWFYGATDNGAVQSFYVKINDTPIAYKGDIANVQRGQWTQANFDLSAVAAAKSVTKLVIGLNNGSSKGKLLIDDICLGK